MPQEQTPGFTTEQLPTPEAQAEQAPEAARIEHAVEPQPIQSTAPAKIVLPTPATPVRAAADPMQKEIEDVLTQNIAEIYKQLPADRKQAFKQKGEEIAAQITHLLRSGIMQIKKILGLIRDWLQIIPGVNKFFLEQEAKIKTDKIQIIFDREHAAAV